tara:strand:- start:20701 stop:21021 length:321 start_codon:yes stop_codon:yes gene_type:complete
MNSSHFKKADKTAGGRQDKWNGNDRTQYFKSGPNPQLTHWGRRAIIERWDSGVKSPLRIAVQLQIPNRMVQYVLHALRGRVPDFTDWDYFHLHTNFKGGTYDGESK